MIVTHNRLALLKESLAAVRAQTRPADEIILVNNASSDGTTEWLATQTGLVVIHQGNLGGAGGFNTGIKEAYRRGNDWFWCMDDDTIPDADCLEAMASSAPASDRSTGFLCSSVRWIDGTLHQNNLQGGMEGGWSAELLEGKSVFITSCSFVSLMVRREAVKECGLPLAPLFIWYDDIEFTHRLGKKYRGYLIPGSRVLHKTADNTGPELENLSDANSFKYSYGLRNGVFFKMHTAPAFHFYNYRASLRMILSTLPLLFRKCSPRVACMLTWSMMKGLIFNPPIEYP